MTDRELLEALFQKVSGLDQDMQGMKQDVQGVKQSISSLDQRMSGVEQGLQGVNQEVLKVNQNISSLEQKVSDVQTLATKTQIILENDVAKKIDALFDGHQLDSEKIDIMVNKLDDMETSVLTSEIVTKNNLKEIAELKRKAQ